MTIEPPFKSEEHEHISFGSTPVPTPPPPVPTPPSPPPQNMFDFKSMKWYEWLISLPTIFLLIRGGLVGAIIGFLGWMYAIKVLRNPNHSNLMKTFSIIGIILASYIIYFVIGIFIISLIGS